MQLKYLLVVVVVSDVKVDNYNIRTELRFIWTEPKKNSFQTESKFFKTKLKPNRNKKMYSAHP